MGSSRNVAVFGAYGHTGRFVVAELHERGYVPLLLGRDQDRLLALAQTQPGLEARQASVDDPASLDRALNGAAAVIN
ncbi:NAD(P)H-binding protein, partial [Streptosporangium canum]|uniref:NAD(P)H-binding protein n=1 Tax=Streptosporangium canum TaxID=324952 RepID=UPI0034174888